MLEWNSRIDIHIPHKLFDVALASCVALAWVKSRLFGTVKTKNWTLVHALIWDIFTAHKEWICQEIKPLKILCLRFLGLISLKFSMSFYVDRKLAQFLKSSFYVSQSESAWQPHIFKVMEMCDCHNFWFWFWLIRWYNQFVVWLQYCLGFDFRIYQLF